MCLTPIFAKFLSELGPRPVFNREAASLRMISFLKEFKKKFPLRNPSNAEISVEHYATEEEKQAQKDYDQALKLVPFMRGGENILVQNPLVN